MDNTVRFTAELWLHSHAETHEPLEYNLFNVSGYQVPIELIDWMRANNQDIAWLTIAGVPTETPVMVQVEASFYSETDYDPWVNEQWWEFGCQGWVTTYTEKDRERSQYMQDNGLGEEDMLWDAMPM